MSITSVSVMHSPPDQRREETWSVPWKKIGAGVLIGMIIIAPVLAIAAYPFMGNSQSCEDGQCLVSRTAPAPLENLSYERPITLEDRVELPDEAFCPETDDELLSGLHDGSEESQIGILMRSIKGALWHRALPPSVEEYCPESPKKNGSFQKADPALEERDFRTGESHREVRVTPMPQKYHSSDFSIDGSFPVKSNSLLGVSFSLLVKNREGEPIGIFKRSSVSNELGDLIAEAICHTPGSLLQAPRIIPVHLDDHGEIFSAEDRDEAGRVPGIFIEYLPHFKNTDYIMRGPEDYLSGLLGKYYLFTNLPVGQVHQLALLDLLGQNSDRHINNVLVREGQIMPIDHDHSFHSYFPLISMLRGEVDSSPLTDPDNWKMNQNEPIWTSGALKEKTMEPVSIEDQEWFESLDLEKLLQPYLERPDFDEEKLQWICSRSTAIREGLRAGLSLFQIYEYVSPSHPDDKGLVEAYYYATSQSPNLYNDLYEALLLTQRSIGARGEKISSSDIYSMYQQFFRRVAHARMKQLSGEINSSAFDQFIHYLHSEI